MSFRRVRRAVDMTSVVASRYIASAVTTSTLGRLHSQVARVSASSWSWRAARNRLIPSGSSNSVACIAAVEQKLDVHVLFVSLECSILQMRVSVEYTFRKSYM